MSALAAGQRDSVVWRRNETFGIFYPDDQVIALDKFWEY